MKKSSGASFWYQTWRCSESFKKYNFWSVEKNLHVIIQWESLIKCHDFGPTGVILLMLNTVFKSIYVMRKFDQTVQKSGPYGVKNPIVNLWKISVNYFE